MYALISGYWYALINRIIILFIESTASTASLVDKGAVYLIESVVGEVSISARGYGTIPYCLRGPSTVYTRRQKRWPFCYVPSGAGLSRPFVGRFAIQGSLESGAFACAIFVTREHQSTNLTRVTSVCAS